MTLSQIYDHLLVSYRMSKKRELDREYVLYRIYRPVSFPLSAVLIKLGLSANQVTFLSFVTLLLASGFFLIGSGAAMVMGAITYALAFLLDFADGNIARFHNKPNYFGKLIDGFVDTLSVIVFIAIAIGNAKASQNFLAGKVELALATTIVLAVVITHYFRMRVTFFVKESGIEVAAKGDASGTGKDLNRKAIVLANRVYKNLATCTPILLLVLAPLQLLSFFILFFVVIHVIMGLAEVVVSLIRLRSILNVYRTH